MTANNVAASAAQTESACPPHSEALAVWLRPVRIVPANFRVRGADSIPHRAKGYAHDPCIFRSVI